ncbi:hypothetical protein SLA2020_071290 [Shorea laevis]
MVLFLEQVLRRRQTSCADPYENFFLGSIHFKDIALPHLLVYENKSASGRHLSVEAITHYGDGLEFLVNIEDAIMLGLEFLVKVSCNR